MRDELTVTLKLVKQLQIESLRTYIFNGKIGGGVL